MIVRDEDWLVTKVEATLDGFFVHVTGLSELVRDTDAVFSTAIDNVVEADPTKVALVADTSDQFRRSRLWLESMLRKTPVAVADPGLTTAHRGLANHLEYQMKAVRKALDPDKLRPRILLADAVGLGKTLEIGMILSELVRRGRGERILIVTPKHVLEQMQMELWTRFALPFVRLDSTGIQRIRRVLPGNRNPFTYYKRVVISIDTLKSDRYVASLRKHTWDAVVIDESHNVTNSTSQNNRLARLLASRTDALILASATPHNGRAESFAELVRMLDPSAVSPTGELDLDEVAKLVIRRHRHHPDVAGEVGSDWAERQPPRNIPVPASPLEDEVARELEQVWLWPGSGTSPYSGKNASLFPWVLAKAYLSSPAALVESVRERRRRLDEDDPATAPERDALDRLAGLAVRARHAGSAKYDALREHLAEIGVSRTGTRRVVIFAERVATLNWLADALAKDLKLTPTRGRELGQVTVLHGGLSDTEQQDIVESFKLESSPIRVLVTGDVASEGVNLHSQCHHLVHYDIPWSLIRIEQRNGRIDRYGQRHRPEITTLLLTPSTERFGGDIRVLTKLVEREHEAHTALGDSASLIGTYDVKAEEDAIREVLAGHKQLDHVVKTVDQVGAGGGLDALFADLATGQIPQDVPEPVGAIPDQAGTGVYPTEFAFLSDALAEFIKTPEKAPPNGVSWTVHKRQSIASLTPPRDLAQRLEVLPQSYLRDRKVTESFKLAYTTLRGEEELRQARSGESTSTWPEAHYLAPLHPIIDWAADRALAELGRDQIFAVRGDVAFPTVLVQVTHTNVRGQVVAASYYTVAFPDPTAPSGLALPHASAPDAVATLALSAVNAGDLTGVDALQPLVAAAVRAADSAADQQATAIRQETAQRVDDWIARSRRWKQEADALVQRADLKRRTARITEEETLAQAMNPDRRLTRPLIVVVPQNFTPMAQEPR
ncbi:superfamily II DNA/RNA helicases, SNF2 family proteinprotein [Rhodococcus aetherivorans]|uniref:Superfamily II DNA/RNA helicases, SNF2 family proteinprotein n=1 Tax=Rhodococcus aetherivorans TaxID=191292 RepID=A0ABQ0YH78_9NOCA|nr:helicase-related protein [Rhodococcus aetherivorans]ETT25599.1 SNF2-related protein [Rhodococcus rhodochrous ATCC 21198]GES35892.1 superfamily II DNA/RNA helicases, SNF2 family proteinprotein [Rhodococcus aetherivorans]